MAFSHFHLLCLIARCAKPEAEGKLTIRALKTQVQNFPTTRIQLHFHRCNACNSLLNRELQVRGHCESLFWRLAGGELVIRARLQR
jgi:hypothetical protein